MITNKLENVSIKLNDFGIFVENHFSNLVMTVFDFIALNFPKPNSLLTNITVNINCRNINFKLKRILLAMKYRIEWYKSKETMQF